MNNDLISREWLEDAFDNLCCHNCKICRNFRIKDSFYKCALIDSAPTVEVIPQGKKDIRKPYGWQFCSECGKVLEPQDNFCWFCGAELREAENGQ